MDSTAFYFLMIYALLIAVLVLVIYVYSVPSAVEFFQNPDARSADLQEK